MLKKLLIVSVLPLFCVGFVLLSGCSTTSSTATTTTAAVTTTTAAGGTTTTGSGGTTTTLPTGTNTISGTISWAGATTSASLCDVLIFRTAELTGDAYTNSFAVTTGQTSVAYTTSGLPNGTYYLVGVIFKGITVSPGKPRVNDVVGEYSDGYVPVSQAAYFDHTSAAGPQAVTVSGSGITGISFTLRATCTSPMP
jgi:hypothetical protein